MLTNDTDAATKTFKQWRESVNGETDSNMQKIDAFAGATNASLNNIVDTYLKKEDAPIVVSDTEPTNSNVSIWVDIS